MKISTIIPCFCMLAIISTAFAQQHAGKASQFSGAWVAVKEGEGLPKLNFTRQGKDYQIQAWGDCEPEDCDWGVVPLHLLGDSVAARDLPYGFASWKARFKITHMTLRIEKGVLIAETYDIFTDDSGRANRRGINRFKRQKASD